MIRRRSAAVLAGLVLAGTAAGGVARAAEPAPVDAPAVTTGTGYWACVAVDHVEVGACLDNPLPDLSEEPSVRERVRRLTGISI